MLTGTPDSSPASELEYAKRNVIASAQIWYCARREILNREDLKGDLQMSMQAAEQDLDEAVAFLAMLEQEADARPEKSASVTNFPVDA